MYVTLTNGTERIQVNPRDVVMIRSVRSYDHERTEIVLSTGHSHPVDGTQEEVAAKLKSANGILEPL